MRISTQMMYQQNMRGITNSQAEWMKFGEQMSTGKRVINPSDDPIAACRPWCFLKHRRRTANIRWRVHLRRKSIAGRKRTESGNDGNSDRAGKNCLCCEWHVKR